MLVQNSSHFSILDSFFSVVLSAVGALREKNHSFWLKYWEKNNIFLPCVNVCVSQYIVLLNSTEKICYEIWGFAQQRCQRSGTCCVSAWVVSSILKALTVSKPSGITHPMTQHHNTENLHVQKKEFYVPWKCIIIWCWNCLLFQVIKSLIVFNKKKSLQHVGMVYFILHSDSASLYHKYRSDWWQYV